MVKVRSDLILPDSVDRELKKGMVEQFNESLEKVVNENQHKEGAYFITYHENDDKAKPFLIRGKWSVHDTLPRFWARQICYWVDNKKGFKEWLWTVGDDRRPAFNVEGVQKAIKTGAIDPKNREAAAGL